MNGGMARLNKAKGAAEFINLSTRMTVPRMHIPRYSWLSTNYSVHEAHSEDLYLSIERVCSPATQMTFSK